MATDSGISLNKTQLVGPTVQDDLLSILLRFRSHQYVLTGDIKMMYRQVLLNPDDRKYQRILWRASPLEPLREFQLNTVTYGTASAPFLATRCLKQLALDNQSEPQVFNAILNDFYVDDLLTGTNTIEELVFIRDRVMNILQSAHFSLRKCMSNHPAVLSNIASDSDLQTLNFNEHENCKTLGVVWNSTRDIIQYSISDL